MLELVLNCLLIIVLLVVFVSVLKGVGGSEGQLNNIQCEEINENRVEVMKTDIL